MAKASRESSSAKTWDSVSAFQCFLTGGITAVTALITLYFLGNRPVPSWQQELLGLIVLAVLSLGLLMMGGGYLRLLGSRLSQFFSSKD